MSVVNLQLFETFITSPLEGGGDQILSCWEIENPSNIGLDSQSINNLAVVGSGVSVAPGNQS